MTALSKNQEVLRRLHARGLPQATIQQASALRRAELVLHKWAEGECGDGNDWASWSIERDETTGIPYRCTYPHTGGMQRDRIPDREAGALTRIRAVCKQLGAFYFHQTDPRGCALYVSAEPMTDSDYNRGISVSV